VAAGFVVEAIMTDSERKTDSKTDSESKDSDRKTELTDKELNVVFGGIDDGTVKAPNKQKTAGRA
jgi:hypothetical protein